MKWYKFALIAIVYPVTLLLADGHSNADEFSYQYIQAPAWAKGAQYKDSYYQGAIAAKCRIKALHGGGLDNLYRFFQKWIEQQGNSDNLKWIKQAKHFDIIRRGKKAKLDALSRTFINNEDDEEGKLKMQMLSHVGYEKDRLLIYAAESQKIFYATSSKKRLGKFKAYYRFSKSETNGYYDVYVWRYYSIGSYWYEPQGMFVDTVRKEVVESFKKDMLEWYRQWAEQL